MGTPILYRCDSGHDFLVALPEIRDCRCGGQARQVADVSTGAATTGSAGGDDDNDRAAARRLVGNMRERLEGLHYDLVSLYRALGGPPGAVSALAAELPDEDQDQVPGPVF